MQLRQVQIVHYFLICKLCFVISLCHFEILNSYLFVWICCWNLQTDPIKHSRSDMLNSVHNFKGSGKTASNWSLSTDLLNQNHDLSKSSWLVIVQHRYWGVAFQLWYVVIKEGPKRSSQVILPGSHRSKVVAHFVEIVIVLKTAVPKAEQQNMVIQ